MKQTPSTVPAIAAPAEPALTTATFEPVHRAAKAVRDAGTSVTYMKFGELMQSFSTEIGIAKNQPLNGTDRSLLALYVEALTHYRVGAELWQVRIKTSDAMWKGEIPIYFESNGDRATLDALATYDLPVSDRELAGNHAKYKSIPGDSPQRVWKRAAAALDRATAMYDGIPSSRPDVIR